jgi:DNA invertase Pin-like site-specific DNA recombinase
LLLMYEGTHKQNQEDMARRGLLKGKGAKITEETAKIIKRMIAQGYATKEIRKIIVVSEQTVSNIRMGNSWAWVQI